MAQTMIERVARALCIQDCYSPDDDVLGGQSADFANFGPRWQANERSENTLGGRNYVAEARVVIAVLGGESLIAAAPEMLETIKTYVAGFEGGIFCVKAANDVAIERGRAMIDAALAEG